MGIWQLSFLLVVLNRNGFHPMTVLAEVDHDHWRSKYHEQAAPLSSNSLDNTMPKCASLFISGCSS